MVLISSKHITKLIFLKFYNQVTSLAKNLEFSTTDYIHNKTKLSFPFFKLLHTYSTFLYDLYISNESISLLSFSPNH